MSQKNDKIKKMMITKAIISASTPLIIAMLVIIVISVVISSILNFITYLDGTVNEDDQSNVPFVVSKYTADATIDDDGNINSSMSANDIWATVKENDGRLEQYLEDSKELQKLIHAEAMSDFLDTRANPDAPINWDEILENPDSTKIQGIIKLKREMSGEGAFTMTYVSPDTFQAYIDKYNETGSEEDKKEALKHFTIEKLYYSSSGGNYTIGTDGIAAIIKNGNEFIFPTEDDPNTDYDERALGTTYTYNSWQLIGAGKQLKLREQAGMTFDAEGFGRINGRYAVATKDTFGGVGTYIDYYYKDSTGQEHVIPCIICDIKGSDAPNPWGHHEGRNVIEFYVNEETWCTPGWAKGVHSWYKDCGKASKMHANPGTATCHPEWAGKATKIVQGDNYFDNPNFVSNKIEENTTGGNAIGGNNSNEGNTNSDSSSEEWFWPTDGNRISSPFGPREAPTEGASTDHKGIDIGVAEGTNVYAADAGTVIGAGNAGNAGNMVTIDHGNGYLTKYMHNSVIKVKVGDKVEKGQVIALSGNTGVSTGAHLHFQIEYNGTAIDPLTVRYSNGMGGNGSGLDSCGFYAKVATWNEETETLTSNPADPDVKQYEKVTYNMASTRIDYKSLVEGYTMPFEYLWDFLMIGGEKEFVLELADLAYDSKLEITIHDNLTTNTSITTENYERETKIETHDVKVDVEYSDVASNYSGADATKTDTVSADQTFGPGYQRQSYETVKNIVTKTNTLDVSLTKADVWFVDYERTYAYTMPAEEVKDSPEETIEGTEFNANPDETSETDGYGYAKKFKEETEEKYKKQYDNVSAEVTKVISDYWYRMAGGTRKVQNKLEKTTYVPGVAKVKEKTDPNSAEPNFVTIYLKEEHEKNASNIYSAYQWLYQCLENNDDTKNMVDLTKYLLYIVTEGTLDEVTDFRDAVDIN